ncbi:MAG: hypothetical protein NTZ33_00890 [Bacteroidetes bacterium]|nr:hypothetical protein [Bacteroidota bacterium]
MRKLNLQKLIKGAMMVSAASMMLLAGCAKDGNNGLDGANGATGPAGANGKDASETCKLCHNPAVVDSIATIFQLSKHEYGTTAEEEAGNTGCTPCHAQEAFKYVCKNNVSTAFIQDPATLKWSNPYATVAGSAYGNLGCFTCHSNLHTTYAYSDLTTFTTVAAVPMTMWGGTKTINLTQDGGKSNLCVKCHQPRPIAISTSMSIAGQTSTSSFADTANRGKWLDYTKLASAPTAIFYDSALATTITQPVTPSYRTHVHYGAVGAVVAGMGGVEFNGTMAYASSSHASQASCEDCHMAPVTGAAGSHSFKAKGNFNGCNNASCHTSAGGLMSSTNADFTNIRTEIKGLIATLGGKLKEGGVEIMNKNGDATTNLWYGYTTANYDGYLNVYDPVNNPNGPTYNTGSFRYMGSTSSWTTAQKATNAAFPKLHLTNAQMGAIINMQFAIREYSLGVHNYKYIKALLTNSIAILP